MAESKKSFLKENIRTDFTAGRTLPRISTGLDSVRAYQFEVRFFGLDAVWGVAQNELTTAAKVVSPIAGAVDDIVVDRLNDKVFYPGKFTPENVTITFDNQLLTQTAPALWNWFKTIYNPMTGDTNQRIGQNAFANSRYRESFKATKMTILELDQQNNPNSYIQLYGVYPQGVRFSEKNYSTNEFSTIEVTFRYDFVDFQGISQFNYGGIGSTSIP